MDEHREIKNLSEVLSLGRDKKLVKYTTRNLTKLGDNFGSLMLALEVTVLDEKDGSEEVLHLAAKLPPDNEWIAEMFNTKVTFKKEIGFYAEILPTLQKFQSSEGVGKVMDFYPKYFGSRISLDPNSNAVDKDAILMLENLKKDGYETLDCTVGFDLPTSELIIKNLAVFHAVPVAFKIKNPEDFQKKIMPHLRLDKNVGILSEEIRDKSFESMVSFVESSEETKHLAERVLVGLKRGYDSFENKTQPREPFGTMVHMDFWVNNVMVKCFNEKSVRSCMIDFQLMEYGSPASDLIFFIFSSVQKEVVDKFYNHLIQLYYSTFINTLKSLNCDTAPFTFDLFEEELENEAINVQFYHVMFMLRPIHLLKDKLGDPAEMSENDLIRTDCLSDLYGTRLREIVLQFEKNNWI